MHRDSIVVYSREKLNKEEFETFVKDYGLVSEIHEGNIRDAIRDARSWRILPTFLVLDISEEEDLTQALNDFAAEAPEGEVSLILLGTENDISLYRRLRRLKASEYITKPLNFKDLSEIITELQRERRERGNDVSQHKTIGFIGARGGVGTSMLTAATAHYISDKHKKKTLLLDLDLSSGSQHIFFDEEDNSSLIDMLDTPKRIDALYLDRTMVAISKTLNLLSCAAGKDIERIPSENLKQLLLQAQSGMDYIVLDIPSHSFVHSDMLMYLGHIYIVTTPNLLGLRDAVQVASRLQAKNYRGKLSIIVNKVGESRVGSVPVEEFEKRGRVPVLPVSFDAKAAFTALMEGKTLDEVRGNISTGLSGIFETLPTYNGESKKKSFWSLITGSDK